MAAGATFVDRRSDQSDTNNGSPTFDLAIDFSPDFQNSGADADGVALFNISCPLVDGSTIPIDAVVYGTANTNNLIDETGVANAPETGDASSGQSVERVDIAGAWQIQALPTPNVAFPAPPPAGLILSEVFYDRSGTDNGWEWVEIYNSGSVTIDLASFSLGYAGTNYASGTYQLSGSVAAGATFVVGGLNGDGTNANPAFDQSQDFSPDIQNSGTIGDGVALFNVPAAAITSSTVPIDAVIYGPNNNNNLIDETGTANAPEVGDAAAGSSIERTTVGGSWQIQANPTPNATPL